MIFNLDCINRVNMTQFILLFSIDVTDFLTTQGSKDDRLPSPSSTVCQSVEIVLPPHANHHKTTFGGQVQYFDNNVIFLEKGPLNGNFQVTGIRYNAKR